MRHLNIRSMLLAAGAGAILLTTPPLAWAGEADVTAVEITADGDGTFRFDVSVRHDDEGWDHYADAWEILDTNGTVLGTRVLLHPHENEQPFTRSLAGVAIPETVHEVTVRARDKVHGIGGRHITVAVPH